MIRVHAIVLVRVMMLICVKIVTKKMGGNVLGGAIHVKRICTSGTNTKFHTMQGVDVSRKKNGGHDYIGTFTAPSTLST